MKTLKIRANPSMMCAGIIKAPLKACKTKDN